MKAKFVVRRMEDRVHHEIERREKAKGPALTTSEAHDLEASIFVGEAWDEFKRIALCRFPSGRASVASFKSFRREFGDWGAAVARLSKSGWMRPTIGTVIFDDFIRMLEGNLIKGANGAEIEIKAQQARPDVKTDVVRCGI